MAYVQNMTMSRSVSLRLSDGKFVKPEASLLIRLDRGEDPVEAAEQFEPVLEYLFLKAQIALCQEAQYHSELTGDYDELVADLMRRQRELNVVPPSDDESE